MLSVGLIPENELSKKAGVEIDPKTKGPVVDENRQTTCEGIFACGNVVKVHELVDFVSEEGETAGYAAACYAAGRPLETIHHSEKRISEKKGVKNLADETDPAVICTVCPIGCRIKVERVKDGYVTEGNNCKRGEAYAIKEVTSPERTLTTIMASDCKKMIPVKTDRPVPKEKIEELMKIINEKTLLLPISLGDIIIENIGGTGANVVCTRSFNI